MGARRSEMRAVGITPFSGPMMSNYRPCSFRTTNTADLVSCNRVIEPSPEYARGCASRRPVRVHRGERRAVRPFGQNEPKGADTKLGSRR